jgi:hypothetical protein
MRIYVAAVFGDLAGVGGHRNPLRTASNTRLQPSIKMNINNLIGSDSVAGGTMIIPSDSK